MSIYQDLLIKHNGLWREHNQIVHAVGFSNADALSRLIYSCEIESGVNQHAAEDLKVVSASLQALTIALEDLFQACSNLPLEEMDKMSEEIDTASRVLKSVPPRMMIREFPKGG